MKIQVLLKKTSEWLNGTGPESDLVLSSRIRIARNIKGFRFPGKATSEDKKKILSIVESVVSSSKSSMLKGSLFVHIHELDDVDRQFLVERHLISPELSNASTGSGVIISNKETISIMINEEDHLRIQVLHSGLQLKEVWKTIDELDTELEKTLDFAFSSKFGYLTACPTNLGTGIRASAMLHLPALVYSKQINKVLHATVKLGLAVRGLYGEGSEALGNLFQISNQASLGMNETEIIETLSKVVRQIIMYEKNQRRYLINNNLKEVEDRVWRAYGSLTTARIITSKETIGLLSTLRMGVDLGILESHLRKLVNELLILTQPANLQKNFDRKLNPTERDIERANLIRQKLVRNSKAGKESKEDEK
ncbi:MAG: protein arginine kinase [Candidatus Aureabacteria bacterium]|nr:protein arginine kinase [Candidatus Auribacterota bacterium]